MEVRKKPRIDWGVNNSETVLPSRVAKKLAPLIDASYGAAKNRVYRAMNNEELRYVTIAGQKRIFKDIAEEWIFRDG